MNDTDNSGQGALGRAVFWGSQDRFLEAARPELGLEQWVGLGRQSWRVGMRGTMALSGCGVCI